ncbi:MAG: radical SAM family heme chaperone HemW [Chlamydiota bacterium]
MTGSLLKAPASLYIHVPFCSKKCPYCHFFILPDSEENQTFFMEHLHKEWLLRAHLLENKEIVSIYFGGGTPSLLPPKSIELILSWIKSGPAKLSSHCEITLEANPEKTNKSLMQEFSLAGINRVSLGVQSFDDTLLQLLGRTHDSTAAKKAVEAVFEAGITNISIDLMYELPYQTLLQWEKSVTEATKLPITHLSLYNLTFEPGTVFYKKQKTLSKNLPSQEEAVAMLNIATTSFPAAGLKRYEISAFAKDDLFSVHNIGYWTARPFLGLGPSAFSYFNNRRFRNIPHLKKWAEKIAAQLPSEDFEETLDPDSRQKELLAVELRLLRGVDLAAFSPLSQELEQSIQKNIQNGYLNFSNSRLSLTEKGLLFYDSVAEEII